MPPWEPWYLWRKACRSAYLLCWQSRALWGRWICTRACQVWDTPHSRCPRQNPLNSSTCPRGIAQAKAPHTHPHATSCSTARYACLQMSQSEVSQECRNTHLKSLQIEGFGILALSHWNWICCCVVVLRFLTHTCASSAVQGETLSTLTAERALAVHTAAVGTHSGEHLTLINIYREEDILRTMTTRTTHVLTQLCITLKPTGRALQHMTRTKTDKMTLWC